MKKVVFDSYALIAFFRGEVGADVVQDLLMKMAEGKCEGWITAINLGEVYYMISRKSNTQNAEKALHAILQLPLTVVNPDLELCLQAAKIKAAHLLSYADAFAAALSINERATLLTGDEEFELLSALKDFRVKYL